MDHAEVEGARVMGELREMARAPMAIFERFMGELHRMTGDKTVAAPVGVERVKELQAFQALRAQAEDSRLTPSQKQAKADLEEIERLKNQVTLATRILASTLKVSGSLAVAGAGRSKGSRVRLYPAAQGRTAVLILAGPGPAMAASVVDASPTGLRLALREDLPPGSVLTFAVRHADGPPGELRMQERSGGVGPWPTPPAASGPAFARSPARGTSGSCW